MTNPLHEEYVRRFPLAKPFSDDDQSFAARLLRLKKQVQGTEPFQFDAVMEHMYSPDNGEVAVDHRLIEHDGRIYILYCDGVPENLGKADPRIRSLGYHGCSCGVGDSMHDLRFLTRIMADPTGEWDCIVPCLNLYPIPYKDGFAGVYEGVGLENRRLGIAFSKDLVTWSRCADNPRMMPPQWAEPYGTCKDLHILKHEDKYLIYWVVTSLDGYSAIAVATTQDFEQFEYQDRPVYSFPMSMRGTGGVESPCIIQKDGIFHLFFCCGQGTWHTISDNPYVFKGTSGIYPVGPFVAAEVVELRGEWWFTSTRKEELRRLDRQKGISNHATMTDELRNYAGLFVSRIRWDGDFPVLEKPVQKV